MSLNKQQRRTLAGMADVKFDALEVIKCGDCNHVVGIINGKFVLLNHSPLYLTEALARKEAGLPPTSECARRFFEFIESNLSYGDYSNLSRINVANISKRLERGHLVEVVEDDRGHRVALEQCPTFIEKVDAKITEAAKKIFRETRYKRPERCPISVEICTPGEERLKVHEDRRSWGSHRLRELQVSLNVSRRWYCDVYTKGIALVDGKFVMAVLANPNENTYRVSAVKQAEDYKVEVREATLYRANPDSPWSLSWSLAKSGGAEKPRGSKPCC